MTLRLGYIEGYKTNQRSGKKFCPFIERDGVAIQIEL